MKYINKLLTDSTLSDNTCWICSGGIFSVPNNSATLKFAGWRDADAFADGLAAADAKQVTMTISGLYTFPLLLQDILTIALGPAGVLAGGVMDAEGSVHSMQAALTGHAVAYWRHAEGNFDIFQDSGLFTLRGWKDQAAHTANADHRAVRTQYVPNMSTLEHYDDLWMEITYGLIQTESGTVFAGAAVEDTPLRLPS